MKLAIHALRAAGLAMALGLGGCALMYKSNQPVPTPPGPRFELYSVTMQTTLDRASDEESQSVTRDQGVVFKLDSFTGKTQFAHFADDSKALAWSDVTGETQPPPPPPPPPAGGHRPLVK